MTQPSVTPDEVVHSPLVFRWRGEVVDPAQHEHLVRMPWARARDCTCRMRQDGGSKFYTCRRKACSNEGKVCGGYCPPCFQRRITNRQPRPSVVVLCGSTRFSEAWVKARYDLTLAGEIVLTIGCDTKSDEGLGITDEQKIALDELHKRKIDLADRVLVLNVGGYIGDSTRSEIEYAEWFEKPIEYLEPSTGDKATAQAGESRG